MEINNICDKICSMYKVTLLGDALGVVDHSEYAPVTDPDKTLENLAAMEDAMAALDGCPDNRKNAVSEIFRKRAIKDGTLARSLKPFLENRKESGIGWVENWHISRLFGSCLDHAALDMQFTPECLDAYCDVCTKLMKYVNYRLERNPDIYIRIADDLVRLRSQKGDGAYGTVLRILEWIPAVIDMYGKEIGYDDLASIHVLNEDDITFPECTDWDTCHARMFVKRLADPEFSSFIEKLGGYGRFASTTILSCGDGQLAKASQLYDKTAICLKSLAKDMGSLEEISQRYVQMMDHYGWDADVMSSFLAKAESSSWDTVTSALSSNAGFADFLSGAKWEKLIHDTVGVNASLGQLMAYAIVKKKTGFLKMVEKDCSAIINLDGWNIFLDEDFWDVCNINALSAKDLGCLMQRDPDGVWTYKSSTNNAQILSEAKRLLEGRKLTFNEVRLLLGHHVNNLYVYLSINTGSVDKNLLRMRQLMKPDIQGLIRGLDREECRKLGESLTLTPLRTQMDEYPWISGLTPGNMLKKSICKDEDRETVEEGFRNAEDNRDIDILFANLGDSRLEEYGIQGFKERFLEFDPDSQWLLDKLEIPEDTLEQNKVRIREFCLSGCASITRAYYNGNGGEQKKNVLLIALAEMLGKMDDLKYNSLKEELGGKISDSQFGCWKQDASTTEGKFTVSEHADFFHVMQIGHGLVSDTCMSYSSGCYRECLLSNFDGNKKILYVSKDGSYCGRAILRLTKYSDSKSESGGRLHFENVLGDVSNKGSNELVLFLERPYQKNVTEDGTVLRALVKAAHEKAEALGIPLVMSADYSDAGCCYRKNGYLYVSRSKNGQQYLDSLGGNCEDGGYYKNGVFLFYGEENSLTA